MPDKPHKTSPRPSFTDCRNLLDTLQVPGMLLHSDGRVAHANAEFVRVCDSARDRSGPWTWLSCVEQPEAVIAALTNAMETGGPSEFELVARGVDAGRRICMAVATPFAGANGSSQGLFVLMWDVTQRRREEQRLAFAAEHDVLTGLGNRRVIDSALRHAIGRAKRGRSSALLLMDLDHLKAINDRFGHAMGDRALIGFAEMLKRELRPSEDIARVGGDEFAVVIEDVDLDQAVAIAERARVRAALGDFVPEGALLGIAMSCGLVVVEPNTSPEEAFERVDRALYEAKALGGNRVVAWTPGRTPVGAMTVLLDHLFEVGNGLRLAFQPVVRVSDWSVLSYEVLARAQPDGGALVDAGEFVPALERRGRTPELLLAVFERLFPVAAANPGRGFCMNLSAADLASQGLLDALESLLTDRADEIDAHSLCIEFSGAQFFGQQAQVEQWIERLGRLGYSFVLEGLGTWAESGQLRGSRLKAAKIGRPMAGMLVGTQAERQYVVAYRRLVESLVPILVAAKLETATELQAAITAGFGYVQGRAVCPPVLTLAEADAFVATSNPAGLAGA